MTTKDVLYAAVGAGDLAMEKLRNVGSVDLDAAQQIYSDLITRGRSLSTRIRNSAPTKQAVAQTKTARSRVKAAATSVTKATRIDARAARAAVQKVARA